MNKEKFRALAKDIARDSIVMDALARLLEQVVEVVCGELEAERDALRNENLELRKALNACLVFVDHAQWWATGPKAMRMREKHDAIATALRARALLNQTSNLNEGQTNEPT